MMRYERTILELYSKRISCRNIYPPDRDIHLDNVRMARSIRNQRVVGQQQLTRMAMRWMWCTWMKIKRFYMLQESYMDWVFFAVIAKVSAANVPLLEVMILLEDTGTAHILLPGYPKEYRGLLTVFVMMTTGGIVGTKLESIRLTLRFRFIFIKRTELAATLHMSNQTQHQLPPWCYHRRKCPHNPQKYMSR